MHGTVTAVLFTLHFFNFLLDRTFKLVHAHPHRRAGRQELLIYPFELPVSLTQLTVDVFQVVFARLSLFSFPDFFAHLGIAAVVVTDQGTR